MLLDFKDVSCLRILSTFSPDSCNITSRLPRAFQRRRWINTQRDAEASQCLKGHVVYGTAAKNNPVFVLLFISVTSICSIE